MSTYPFMNYLKRIRTEIFEVSQAEFARIAGVSQPTIHRWESDEHASTPPLQEMNNIRSAAIKRGIDWRDEWFFSPKRGRKS